ncbi:lysophospholipid acyltransferase family protein [Gleimia hominis]|uniref:lysophospholipid acyltransferase family protein n=1 Tax=Gleimia hominis TaxID=595468 RepID=UPI001E4DBD55|nr:lysophospholipid acyltransferase family protein [Gleimia hominis]WIK65338.1 lysophospholipid acyltransferase family protein [Gleimia hominis]
MSKKPEGMYKAVLRITGPLIRPMMRTHWTGQENLPKEGPFILIMNHVTEFDPFMVMYYLGDEGHAVRALAKDSLFHVPLLKTVLKRAKMVPVHRSSSEAGDALKNAKNAIAHGESIAFFPEGTLTRDPDMWPMTFKTGAARLAFAMNVPVIPLAQWGGHKIMHRFRDSIPFLKGRQDVWVHTGPAIDLSDLNQDEEDRAAVHAATRRMQRVITQMVAALRNEEPPRYPWNPKLGRYLTADDDAGDTTIS